MLGQLHLNRPEGYDYFVDALLGVISKSGDNVATAHSEKRMLEANRSNFLYSEIAKEEQGARNRVYILAGMVVFALLIGVIILFKK